MPKNECCGHGERVLCFVSRKLFAITEWDFLAVLE
jgi:hypothetical protein